MVVLVTGGAGFLGRHLVNLLLSQGHEVVVIDSMWTGSFDNIKAYDGNKKFRYVECDVRDPLPHFEDIDQIYHLACPASPDHFDSSPVEILETCYRGTKNVLDYALERNARILIASTSEIYGDPEVDCQAETYRGNVNCFGPRSCYDEGKRTTEALAFAYRSRHNLEVRIARIFNAYGPYMTIGDGRAVPNFIQAAIEGSRIVIYGDGSATRCFQFATDCVTGLNMLMNSDYSEPVNIGSDNEMPVGQMAEIIADLVAKKLGRTRRVPIVFLPRRTDDPVRRKPDISLARRVLGWQPQVELDEGIGATIDWFLERANGMSETAKL